MFYILSSMKDATIHQMKNKKFAIFLALLGLLSLVTSTVISYGMFSRNLTVSLSQGNMGDMFRTAEVKPLNLKEAPQDLKTLNVLLLGYGGAGHDGGYLTDVIQIVHVDYQKQKVVLISIPRDLWVQLPNGVAAKINEAYTLGLDPNQQTEEGDLIAKTMASAVTGMEINYYIAVDFVGFKRIVGEELDSITVEVPETLEDPWYPIKGKEQDPCGMTPEEVAEISEKYSGFELEKQFECRYEHLLYQKGTVQMEGGDALKYVRSRHGSAAGDFSRSQRQQAVLQAIKAKLLSLDALSKAPQFFKAMQKHVATDIDLNVVEYIVPTLTNINDFTVESVVLSTDNVFTNSKSATGQFIVVPKNGDNNWDQVHQYVQEQL